MQTQLGVKYFYHLSYSHAYVHDNVHIQSKTYPCTICLCTASVECKNTDGTVRLLAVEVLIGYVIATLRIHAQDYVNSRKWCPEAESNSSLDLCEVVLGLPATYTGKQKDVLRAAALLAGFTEVSIYDLSTAICIHPVEKNILNSMCL